MCSCKKAAWKSAKTVGKDSGCERRGLCCVKGQTKTIYRLEAGKIAYFEKCVQAGHSNVFPYFTGLPVNSSLYRRYRSRARLHHLVWYSPSLLWHIGVIIWQTTCTDKIASNSNSIFVQSARFSLSRSQIPFSSEFENLLLQTIAKMIIIN